MNEITKIFEIIYTSFIDIWQYLVLTIPLSVAVHVSGVAKHINLALRRKPLVSIILATVVGAFSPFCSCGIIPIIVSMLIGGVPLAPIMSFWVASPSMDPEMFFLSVSMLGWNLAFWRLGSTLVLSLAAGFMTHYLVKINWFGENILITSSGTTVKKMKDLVVETWRSIKWSLVGNFKSNNNIDKVKMQFASNDAVNSEIVSFSESGDSCKSCESQAINTVIDEDSCVCKEGDDSSYTTELKPDMKSLTQKVLRETWDATYLVAKFMGLAFFVKALISLYVPDGLILGVLGEDNIFSVIIATLIGIPFYTSNLAALPIIGGFLEQGMDPGAALAFLIAGPITTLPAMAAVWGIANKRVFYIYLLIPLLGAILLGYLFNFMRIF